MPKSTIVYLSLYTEKEFFIFKNAYLSWIDCQMVNLRRREEYRNGNLDSLILEEKFSEILKRITRKKSWSRNATFLAQNFDKKQMGIIYSQLDDLIESCERNSDYCGFRTGDDAVLKFRMSNKKPPPHVRVDRGFQNNAGLLKDT